MFFDSRARRLRLPCSFFGAKDIKGKLHILFIFKKCVKMKILLNNTEIITSVARLITEINANLIGFCDFDEVRISFHLDWQRYAKTELLFNGVAITELGSVSTRLIVSEIL